MGSAADLFFPTEDLVKTATAYGVKPVILPDMCHDMQLDPAWEKGTDEILRFISSTLSLSED